MQYVFPLTIDLGETVSQVGELFESLNATLSMYGVSERVGCRVEIGQSILTVGRTLTDEEVEMVRHTIESVARERMPELDLRVGTPRRNSGKSSNQSTAT